MRESRTGTSVGISPSGIPFIELLADGQVLSMGTATPRIALKVFNPNLLETNLQARVLASLPPNQLPEFSSAPTIAANVGASYRYAAQAVDPDGASISYVLAKGPDGASLNQATGVVDWTPARSDTISEPFELRAYDARGAYRIQSWTVRVTGVNAPPVLLPLADVATTEGEILEISLRAYDPDGDRVFFWGDNLPPGAAIDSVSQVLRWRPGGDAAGRYENVVIHASDGAAIVSESFQIVVTNHNLPPELQPIVDRTLREGDSLVLQLFGQDIDGDALNYRSTNLPPRSFLDPNTGVFEWTPGFDQHGVWDIEFQVTDETAVAEQTTRLTVENVNGSVKFPRFDNFLLFEGQTIQIRVAAIDPEHPGGTVEPSAISDDFFAEQGLILPSLDYSHVGLPAGATYDSAKQLFTWTPTISQSGDYEMTFTATDDGDGTGVPSTATATIAMTVSDANGRPQFETVANQTRKVGESLDLLVSAIDPEGGGLVLSASLDETVVGSLRQLPAFVTFTDNGDGTARLVANPQPGDRGSYLIVLTATEVGSPGVIPLSTTAQFLINVTSLNEPPVLPFLPSRVATIGEEIALDIRATDSDQDPLNFSAATLPDGAVLESTGIYGLSRFRWTPTAQQSGTQSVSIAVTDSGNLGAATPASDSGTFTFTVRTSNSRPSLNPLGAQTLFEGETLVLQPEAFDADGNTLSDYIRLSRQTERSYMPPATVSSPLITHG